MKKISRLQFAALALVMVFSTQIWAQAAGMQEQNLYKRLGGYDALAAVTDDFLARMKTDAQLSRFFTGFSVDSQQQIRNHIIDFLCHATGGPCVYTGRNMKTSHTGLNITEADWQAAVKDLTATLNKFNVPVKEHQEVMGAISNLKDDIVGH